MEGRHTIIVLDGCDAEYICFVSFEMKHLQCLNHWMRLFLFHDIKLFSLL